MAQYDKLINLGLLSQFLTKAKTIFAPKITASGILKGDGNGGVSAATAGTDYTTPAQSLALGLTGASVGDLVRVNAVDANGKPTSWKHVPLNEIKCNKNLLDNWYFVGGGSQLGDGVFPINQRGQATYSGAGYGIDRWKAGTGHGVTLNGDSITVTNTSDHSWNMFYQIVQRKFKAGTILTFSAFIKKNTPYTTSQCILSVYTVNGNKNVGNVYLTNTDFAVYSGKFTMPYDDYLKVAIRVKSANYTPGNDSADIKAVKLELGSEQTLAHNGGTEENPIWVLNEIPDYATELRKCQRYFVRINPGAWANIGFTYAANENVCSTLVALPTTMPQNPVVTFNGDLLVKNAVTSTQATGNISGSSVSFAIQTTGLTVREVNTFRAGQNGGYIDISAEQ